MHSKYIAAMRKAATTTSPKGLMEATRLIQSALLGDGPLAGFRPAVSPAGKPATGKRRSKVTAPLADVVERLARVKAGAPAAAATRHAAAQPDGAEFLSGSFTAPAGTRAYKLYVPASLRAEPAGLVVMLHGCTQNPDDFAAGTGMNAVAEEHGLLVLYPAQPRSANANGCWNWFEPRDQRRGAGEPSLIAGMTAEIVAKYGVPPGRVWVAGLSAGGAMALVAATTYPELFSAVGVHSGLPYASAGDVGSAFMVMRGDSGRTPARGGGSSTKVRTIVFQGDRDSTVHASNGARIFAEANSASGDVTTLNGNASGRAYSRTVVRGEGGRETAEYWLIAGAGHAWSGGSAAGSYADPQGPDASREMLRFFMAGA